MDNNFIMYCLIHSHIQTLFITWCLTIHHCKQLLEYEYFNKYVIWPINSMTKLFHSVCHDVPIHDDSYYSQMFYNWQHHLLSFQRQRTETVVVNPDNKCLGLHISQSEADGIIGTRYEIIQGFMMIVIGQDMLCNRQIVKTI